MSVDGRAEHAAQDRTGYGAADRASAERPAGDGTTNRADGRTGCNVRAVRVAVVAVVVAVAVVVTVIVIAVIVIAVVVPVRIVAVLVRICRAAGHRNAGGESCRKTKLPHRLVLPQTRPLCGH